MIANLYSKENLCRVLSPAFARSNHSATLPSKITFTKEQLESALGVGVLAAYRTLKFMEREGWIKIDRKGVNWKIEISVLEAGVREFADYKTTFLDLSAQPKPFVPVVPIPVGDTPPKTARNLLKALNIDTPSPVLVDRDLQPLRDEEVSPKRGGDFPNLAEPRETETVIAAIDFDNVTIGAQRAGFNLSWGRLIEFIRSFGKIALTPEVYLPPQANRNENIFGVLWAAGIKPVICPLRNKDRDDVDRKMLLEARRMMDVPGVTTLLIVSSDGDFDDLVHYAKDRKIKVVQVNVANHRAELEGTDAQPKLRLARMEGSLVRAVELLTEKTDLHRELVHGSLPALEKNEAVFIATVIQLIFDRESERELSPHESAFNRISDAIGFKLNSIAKYRRVSAEKLRAALSELRSANVLRRLEDQSLAVTYYLLDREHPATIHALQIGSNSVGAIS